MPKQYDVFISYKHENSGATEIFAGRIREKLILNGYSVYFNPYEETSGDFIERIRLSVKNSIQLLLILTPYCLQKLKENDKVDFVREELITAYENNISIVPIIMPGVIMPKDESELPEKISFLYRCTGLSMPIPEEFDVSQFDKLCNNFLCSPTAKYDQRDVYNSNSEYDVCAEMKRLKRIIQEGNCEQTATAKYELANMYYYGIADDTGGSKRNYIKAFDLFMELTKSENEYKYYAAGMVGRMFNDGETFNHEQSFEKSYKYHSMAAEKNGESANTIAFMKANGRGCVYDYDEAEALYKAYVKKGNDIARSDFADFYIKNGKYKEALEILKSIKIKSSRVNYRIGDIYKSGLHCDPPKPDYDKAFRYFIYAVNGPNPIAIAFRELGAICFNGCGDIDVNFIQAEKYYLKGAELGDVGCQYMLGFMYQFGYNEFNIKKSEKYFLMADSQGDVNSAHHLAFLYQEPELQNYHKAFLFAEKSANNGKPEGELIFANFLFIGRGCVADVERAKEYYQRAYDHGMYQAKMMIDKISSK